MTEIRDKSVALQGRRLKWLQRYTSLPRKYIPSCLQITQVGPLIKSFWRSAQSRFHHLNFPVDFTATLIVGQASQKHFLQLHERVGPFAVNGIAAHQCREVFRGGVGEGLPGGSAKGVAAGGINRRVLQTKGGREKCLLEQSGGQGEARDAMGRKSRRCTKNDRWRLGKPKNWSAHRTPASPWPEITSPPRTCLGSGFAFHQIDRRPADLRSRRYSLRTDQERDSCGDS
jgi:hypothetical protein